MKLNGRIAGLPVVAILLIAILMTTTVAAALTLYWQSQSVSKTVRVVGIVGGLYQYTTDGSAYLTKTEVVSLSENGLDKMLLTVLKENYYTPQMAINVTVLDPATGLPLRNSGGSIIKLEATRVTGQWAVIWRTTDGANHIYEAGTPFDLTSCLSVNGQGNDFGAMIPVTFTNSTDLNDPMNKAHLLYRALGVAPNPSIATEWNPVPEGITNANALIVTFTWGLEDIDVPGDYPATVIFNYGVPS